MVSDFLWEFRFSVGSATATITMMAAIDAIALETRLPLDRSSFIGSIQY
jgi:hypothetical protein